MGSLPFNVATTNTIVLKNNTKHMIMQRALTSKGCHLLLLTSKSFIPSLVPTTSTQKKNKNQCEVNPQNFAPSQPIPFPSLLHKSTTTSLNDKKEPNIDIQSWDTNMTFSIHTVNPENKMLDPFLVYMPL